MIHSPVILYVRKDHLDSKITNTYVFNLKLHSDDTNLANDSLRFVSGALGNNLTEMYAILDGISTNLSGGMVRNHKKMRTTHLNWVY